jgi:hypothetical protein
MSLNLFRIKSFRGGISDWENTGVTGSFKFGSNLDIHKDIDSLTCNYALTDDLAAGTLNGLPLWIVPCSNGNSYFFTDTGRIYKRTSAGSYSLVYTDADGRITGACEWSNNAGDVFLYWATATKLHRMVVAGNWTSDVDATVNSQTYPKNNLTSATWHTMKQINGTMLICNAAELAMVAWDDSYTNSALSLIPGNLSKCLMEYGGYAYIGNVKSDSASNAEMFVWDTAQSLNWNSKNTIPFSSINALINAEYPLMQAGINGQILLADSSSYTMPIVSFPGGGQVNPDAVEIDGGLALFGSYGNGTNKTGIYSYGRKKKNANLVLNLEYAFDCDEIGSVKKIGTDLLFTYESTGGTSWGVKKVGTDKATGLYHSLDLIFPVSLKETTLDKIRIVTAPLPAGTSIACYRRMDKSGGFSLCYLEGGGTSFNTTSGQEAWFLVGDKGKIAEIELLLIPSGIYAPEVYDIQAYFS